MAYRLELNYGNNSFTEICDACGKEGQPQKYFSDPSFRTTLIRIGGATRHSQKRVCLDCANAMKAALDAIFRV